MRPFLAVLVLSALSVSGAWGSGPPLDPGAPAAAVERHVDGVRGFSIDRPDGWDLAEGSAAGGGHVTRLVRVGPGEVGGVAVSVTVAAVPGTADLAALVDAKLAAIAADHPEVTDLEDATARLDGEPARRLHMDVVSEGTTYRVVQWIALHAGQAYTLQWNAPAERAGELADELGALAATFAFEQPSVEALRAEALRRLAARCGSEVDWATSWDEAARRAREERKPVLAVAWLYGAFDLPGGPRSTVFMDEDVVRLVQERCVPWWLVRGEAQLVRPDGAAYGMGPNTFGQALLVVDAEGRVRAELSDANEPVLAWNFLVRSLAAEDAWAPEPLASGPSGPSGLGELERAHRALDRGELTEALRPLETATGHEAAHLRARLGRLLEGGRGVLDDLLEALDRVPEEDLETRCRYACEVAAQLACEGRADEAEERLTWWALHAPEVDGFGGRARALHDLAGLRLVLGDGEGAAALYERVVDEHPDTRWAWSSARTLTSDVLSLGLVFEPQRLDPRAALAATALAGDRPEPLAGGSDGPGAEGVSAAAREALAFLLAAHVDDAMPHPSALGYQRSLGANPFVDATTAVAGRAFLAAAAVELAPAPELRDHARRCVDAVVASVASRAEVEPVVLYMDYMTWSDGALLELLAEATAAGVASAEELGPTVAFLVADLAARQQENGGWSYYKKNDLSAADVPPQSISFTTAAVSLALSRTAAAGFPVPDALRARSTRALEELRDPAGVFAYFLHQGGRAPHAPIANPAGDLGRGPACELALYRAGASDAARLERSIDRFLEHAGPFADQRGKALMHAGPEGQGCHYLLFDYGHAALAAAEALAGAAPDGAARARRARLLDLIGDCRQVGGSYLDTPINGHAYGTAMALLAFLALDPIGPAPPRPGAAGGAD